MKKLIRTILIDDEPLCTAGLEIDLKEVNPIIEVIAKCNQPEKAIEQIKLLKPDLVFLDIEMPNMNGFELLASFDKIDFSVIFVTAYDEYALQAFRNHAIDYIMKPVDRVILKKAIDKAIASFEDIEYTLKLENLLNALHLGQQSKKLSVPNADGYDLITIEDILYCKSHGNYTEIFFGDSSKLYSRVLKQIEISLEGHNFHRVHASYLVNLNKVKSIHRNDGGYLVMENDYRVSMSRTKKGDVFDKLK